MTPGARLSAAIAVLDQVLAGVSAEKALTNWGRASRFAGSGDRAAVRDLVFDALRCLRSAAALGGGMTGRGVILGRLRAQGLDSAALFTGLGHAPAPVEEAEAGRAPEGLEAWDIPDWLGPVFDRALGPAAQDVALALRARAPVFLRVNTARMTLPKAQEALRVEGIDTRPHPLAATALEVLEGARKLSSSKVYLDGGVELQDAASQAVVAALPLADGMRVLDFCAGGGGKTLAMAARARLDLVAHDASQARMRDLPARAARAGAKVSLAAPGQAQGAFDLVLVDAPCSGSGAWRRSPEAKWRLTPERLHELTVIQAEVLTTAARLTRPGGWLAYATCSLFSEENDAIVDQFLAKSADWQNKGRHHFTPLQGGDGFFLSLLRGVAR